MAFGIHFSAHLGCGGGPHPFLLEALFTASVDAVADEYALMPRPGLDLGIRTPQPPCVCKTR